MLSACKTPAASLVNVDGAPLTLFAQLADVRALGLVCDKRAPEEVARDWSARERRARAIEVRLRARYGEAAVSDAQVVNVFGGCFVGTAEAHRRDYDALLVQLERKLES